MTSELADIIIIGGGPAGLTAALYAARLGMKTRLFEGKSLGGRASEVPKVWNLPGFVEGISGVELIDRIVKQTEKAGAEIVFPEEILDIALEGRLKTVATRSHRHQFHALIIATGTQRKKLLVPGEAEFLGRGVSYCAVCDGPLFKGKTVAVIGSGNEALQDALYLSSICGKVHLITHTGEVTAEKALADECAKKPNIKISKGRARSVLGDDAVKSIAVLYPEDDREVQIPIDGVFISIGEVPVTNLVRKAGVAVDERGCIKVDRRQATNVDGVYAAGDCTCGGMQIVTAVGEGAMAAMQAYRYVRKVKP